MTFYNLFLMDDTGKKISMGRYNAKDFQLAVKEARKKHEKSLKSLATRFQWKITDGVQETPL